MRWEHARAVRTRILQQAVDGGQKNPESVGAARHARRAKPRDAVLWQPAGNAGYRAWSVEGIDAFDAVDVNVNETRHDDVVVKVEGSRAGGSPALHHIQDAAAFNDERPRALQTIREHEIRACQNNHGPVIYR
jgi:hypothetical protein